VFAHRGGAALRPENTLAAFDHGMSAGADGLELDVQLSRDGDVVVIHDAMVDRTTDAQGPVCSFTTAQLSRMDAGYFFDIDGTHPFRGGGCRIPIFRDVLRRYVDVPLIVELKGVSHVLAAAAVREVRAANAIGRVCFGGFDMATVRAVRACGADIVTSAAGDEIRSALRRAWFGLTTRQPGYRAFQVPERYGTRQIATRRFIRVANRGGIAVQVWTVNDPSSMERLLSWGVQALITDRPDLASPIVRAFNQRPHAGLDP
jgi:glycerophosphoryl diester phosphodiesterase